MRKYKPQDATIAITYKCNSRCRMCNIWQIKNAPDLPISALKNLGPDLKYINLSGGEPFLRPDIEDIVREISRIAPKSAIIISTNGLMSGLIAEKTANILKIHPNTGVRVSLDGLKETHNSIRGIDIHSRAMETIRLLKAIGLKNLGVSFTLMDSNIDDLLLVYNWASKNDLQFAMAVVQNSDIYFSKSDNKVSFPEKMEKSLVSVIRRELSSLDPKRWARAFYDYGLLANALKGKRLLKSGAGFDSLFIDPNGDVFPSNLINIKMGNIQKDRLDKIWNSKKAQAARDRIASENIRESWIVCTIRGEMKKNPHKVLWWVITRKLGLKGIRP